MRKLSILVIVVALLVLSAGAALAKDRSIEGRPDMLDPGHIRGYFVWRDDDGLHLRTTTRGHDHVFSGVIRTDGKFEDVDGRRLEHGDYYRLSRDRDTITFRFTTAAGLDGFDFRVDDGKRLNFDLFMDGHRIDVDEIYIGERGWHPQHSEFTLHRLHRD